MRRFSIRPTVKAAGSVGYGYEGAGRRTSMTTANSTTTYGYDTAGLLETLTDTVAGTFGFTNSYDAAGWLKSTTGAEGIITYNWDTNGNLTGTSAGDTYEWTSRNMLAFATVDGVSESYLYDATDTRVHVDGDDWLWDRLGGPPSIPVGA